MPEGHSVLRNARELSTRFAGERVEVSSPQGRFAEGAALLDGQELRGAQAHGKHLFVEFGGARHLHVHLGLYGKWTTGDGDPEPPRGQVRLRVVGEGGWADLRGPTACEVLDPDGVDALHARLGEDPLRPDADMAAAFERVHRSRTTIAAQLMQQEVVAGVGVVYRAEVLFRAGIDPYRPGRDITPQEWEAVWTDLVLLMGAGVKAGRIVTTRPEHRVRPRGRPTRADSFYVYRRAGEPCRICATPIAHAQLVNRNLTWCPTCQSH